MTDISILRASLARAGVSDGAFESGLAMALEVVCREVEANRQQIMPEVCLGIHRLLTRLSQQDALLGVASGNLETVGWHKIEAARLRDYFSFGFFSDHCERRADIFRNATDHATSILGTNARVCFIGDTPSDIQAAREAGGLIVAVASGTFARDELNALSPDLCLSDCVELIETR
jgi:phosphoglycolate phosphatase-like HAD superfamily hydrolase